MQDTNDYAYRRLGKFAIIAETLSGRKNRVSFKIHKHKKDVVVIPISPVSIIDKCSSFTDKDTEEIWNSIHQKALHVNEGSLISILNNKLPRHLKNIASESKKNTSCIPCWIIFYVVFTVGLSTFIGYVGLAIKVTVTPRMEAPYMVKLTVGIAIILVVCYSVAKVTMSVNDALTAKKTLFRSSINLAYALLRSRDIIPNMCNDIMDAVYDHAVWRRDTTGAKCVNIEKQLLQLINKCNDYSLLTLIGASMHLSMRGEVGNNIDYNREDRDVSSEIEIAVTDILQKDLARQEHEYIPKLTDFLKQFVSALKKQYYKSADSEVLEQTLTDVCNKLRTNFMERLEHMSEDINTYWLSEQDRMLITQHSVHSIVVTTNSVDENQVYQPLKSGF